MPTQLKPLLTSLLTYASILIATLIAVDVACFLLLSNEIARKFGGYRVVDDPRLREEALGGRAGYPKDYFTSHPTRGFDISPGKRGKHSVDGVGYPIWSNSLGCFDQEWKDVPPRYFYFAGDSSTWGYTPYEQKFATLFEERTGIASLKCGVTHTGQLHQFEKFQDIIRRVGTMPRHVIVGYSTNDVENDYAHPHSTVVKGWLVDDVFLDRNYSKVRVDSNWIEREIAVALSRQRVEITTNALWAGARKKIIQYSISAQIFRSAIRNLRTVMGSSMEARAPSSSDLSYNGRLITNIYSLEPLLVKDGKFNYTETAFSAANRQALIAWREHAKINNYQLTFLLVPYREIHENRDFFVELREFMRANDIDYIDLTMEFRALGASADQVYWQFDGHMSPGGNRLVAEILILRLASELTPERR